MKNLEKILVDINLDVYEKCGYHFRLNIIERLIF